MTDWGTRCTSRPGIVVDGELRDDEPRRHQPRHPHPARQLLLRGLGERGDVRRPTTRSATRSTSATRGTRRRSRSRRSATSRRQLQLGDEPALVRQAHRRPPRARHRRRPARAAVGDGARRTWSTRRTSSATGHERADQPAARRRTSPEMTLEWKIPQWSNTIERDRARVYFIAYAGGDGAATSSTRRSSEVRAGRRRRCSRTSRCPTRRSAAASTRRCAACSRTTS